jgi:hypothetical protein
MYLYPGVLLGRFRCLADELYLLVHKQPPPVINVWSRRMQAFRFIQPGPHTAGLMAATTPETGHHHQFVILPYVEQIRNSLLSERQAPLGTLSVVGASLKPWDRKFKLRPIDGFAPKLPAPLAFFLPTGCAHHHVITRL